MSNRPTRTASEATDERHVELAREAGAAYQRAFRHLAADVANSGEFEQAGDYVVAYAQDHAAGAYRGGDGDLEWVGPSAENCHLAVAVADAVDGRFVPGLSVRATLTAANGEAVGPVDLPFAWHPGVYHYGANLTVPGGGTYDLRVEIDPAGFARHDRDNGDRFAEAVDVTFRGIDVACGQG